MLVVIQLSERKRKKKVFFPFFFSNFVLIFSNALLSSKDGDKMCIAQDNSSEGQISMLIRDSALQLTILHP